MIICIILLLFYTININYIQFIYLEIEKLKLLINYSPNLHQNCRCTTSEFETNPSNSFRREVLTKFRYIYYLPLKSANLVTVAIPHFSIEKSVKYQVGKHSSPSRC